MPLKDFQFPPICFKLAELFSKAGGCTLLVGGSVRDALLNIDCKDWDLEVFGLSLQRVEEILRDNFSCVRTVGKTFGVFQIDNFPVDISLPRTELKIGKLHTDFKVTLCPQASYREAAYRRDFTINTLGWDLLQKVLYDPFDGYKDLKHKILRCTSEKFSEDPLRVLRGMQFISRFHLTASIETKKQCALLNPNDISLERIWEEIKKLAKPDAKPSLGLQFLEEIGWLRYCEPLQMCSKSNEWKPFLEILDLAFLKSSDGYLLSSIAIDRLYKFGIESFLKKNCPYKKVYKMALKDLRFLYAIRYMNDADCIKLVYRFRKNLPYVLLDFLAELQPNKWQNLKVKLEHLRLYPTCPDVPISFPKDLPQNERSAFLEEQYKDYILSLIDKK